MKTGLPRRVFMKLALLGPAAWLLYNPFSTFLAFGKNNNKKGDSMKLPQPELDGKVSVEKAIKSRRTVRSFKSRAIALEDLSQLLYAAQGITDDHGFKRAAPSGGALYPLDIYAVVGKQGVEGLKPGNYHYVPQGHGIEKVCDGDRRGMVATAALHQMWMAEAPVNFVITAEYSRICSKYGNRGIRYAMIEAGHVGQNIFLQAEALGLKAGIVGAFNDREVGRVMEIPKEHEPLLIMPVGYER